MAAVVLASAEKAKSVAGRSLARQPSKATLAKQVPGPLSLEDTISVATALLAIRTSFVIIHIGTTGPDPMRDEILAIHAMNGRPPR